MPEPSGEVGLADVKLVEAIHESIRTHAPVVIHAPIRKRRPSEKVHAPARVHAAPPH
ncbi:MAG: hypothetical protein JST54_00205 [Deltaproteobacteria bacterium]|nr:hypothetical protein [Deltaproteobacteria bacterium]